MTTIDHAGALAMSDPQTLTDERVARRALQVARRTALGVLGDSETAADIAQEVAITAARRAASLRDPAALDAWLHRIAGARRCAKPAAPADDGRPSARGPAFGLDVGRARRPRSLGGAAWPGH